MLNKQELIQKFQEEVPITIKVLKAVPRDQVHFKPHDKSNSVHQLIKTFIGDLMMSESFARGIVPEDVMSKITEFTSIDEGIEQLQTALDGVSKTLSKVSDDDLNQEFSAWGINKTRTNFVLWMLFDHIHHRGQLSVYVRLAGGLVPSIYGPSADDNGQM